MLKSILLIAALALPLSAQNAKNVILFLGDAGGVSTLNAAGILGHDKPQSLYIQSMPYVGLSDTSTASQWVTDSAAGMTAIVTGQSKRTTASSRRAPTPCAARATARL